MTAIKTNMISRFVKLIQNSEPESISHFITVLINHQLKCCNHECLYNKIVCTLRPKCPDRRFLDILIGIDYQGEDFPRFCYELRLKELSQLLKYPDMPFPCDILIRLDDFFNLIFKNEKLKTIQEVPVFSQKTLSKFFNNLPLSDQ